MSKPDAVADIAIVGGGLMGATLALLLAKVLPDRRVVLCEKAPLATTNAQALSQPSFDERSTALSPTSIDTLRQLGVWDAVRFAATAIQQIHVSDRGHLGWVALNQNDNQGKPLGYVVENRALGWGLTQAFARHPNLRVLAPVSVARIGLLSNHAQLEWADNEQDGPLRASLAIIADGADSPLRSQLGIHAQVKDYNQVAVVANVRCTQAHQGVAYERFTRDGPLALLPLQGSRGDTVAMVWTWPVARQNEALALTDQAFLQRLQHTFGYRLGGFSQISPRNIYPLSLVLAQEQVRRNVVLMGNAAHFLHPVAGQGYNLAVRDGLRLAEVLSQADPTANLGDFALLERYLNAQLKDQRRTVLLSDTFNGLFSSKTPGAAVARNSAMFAVQTQSFLRSLFIRQMSGRASAQAKPWG